METHEILDRYELLYGETSPVLSDIRRVVIDEDLSSIFRIAASMSNQQELIDEFRKATMEKNPHAISRIVSQFTKDDESYTLLVEDIRKAVVEENHRSIFRVFEYAGINIDDLRKAMTEKNHRSIFRVFAQYGLTDELEDLRKAMTEKNHRAIFRVFAQYGLTDELEDLRKAMTEKNHRAIFRVFDYFDSSDKLDDLRKAIIEKNHYSIFRVLESYGETGLEDLRKIASEDLNLHALFRLLPGFVKVAPLDDLRRAIVEDNLHALFRLIENEETLPVEDIRKAVVEDNLHALFRLIENEETLPVEDIRKAVVEDNLHALFRLVDKITEEDLVDLEQIADTIDNAPGDRLIKGADEHYFIDDLRRGILEKNLYSVFRVLEEFQTKELLPLSMPMEDLRKAILEENIHSIFRVLARLDAENRQMNALRQAVVNKDIRASISLFIDEPPVLFDTLPRTMRMFPDIDLRDAFSRGQISSKKWLADELKTLDLDLGTVFLCAGWYGSLALLLFESGLEVEKIRSFDKDAECHKIADTINRPYVMSEWKFKAQTADIHEINYTDGHEYITLKSNGEGQKLYDKPDTVINTSSEHIENFKEWYTSIAPGTLVILQTNDYFEIVDHINCVKNIDAFKDMAPMSNILFEGTLNLEFYNRYMLIGYR